MTETTTTTDKEQKQQQKLIMMMTPVSTANPFESDLYESNRDIIIAKYLSIWNNNQQNKIVIKFLNESTHQWETVTSSSSSLLQRIRFRLFPKLFERSRMTAITTIGSNLIHCYVTNNEWTSDGSAKMTLMKIIIQLNNNNNHELKNVIQIPLNGDVEIFNMQILDKTCHAFYVKKRERYKRHPNVYHSVVNNENNQLKICHIINWIYDLDPYSTSITSNEHDKTLIVQQHHDINITFYKYFLKTNQWKRNDKMNHLRNLTHKKFTYGDCTTIIYLKNNIKIIFDGITTKVWMQSLNSNNNNNEYIPTGITLPTYGIYDAWICDKNEKKNEMSDSVLITGFTRELFTKWNLIHLLPPIHLLKIILGYFHHQQLNLILIESWRMNQVGGANDNHHHYMLESWTMNSKLFYDFDYNSD